MKKEIMQVLDEMFPNPQCELNFSNHYELLVSVMLSAQTTDKSVNKVNKTLFNKYPNLESLKDANLGDVIEIIKPIGLSNSKAKNIIMMAKMVCEKYQGNIPTEKAELVKLAGVGVKTANVYLAVGLGVNAFAVDTHVLRVSNRLGISKSDNPLVVEKDLMKFFEGEDWKKLHHQFIHFGRYHCKAKGMNCKECQLKHLCIITK